eukprot:CAMPEP_0198731786 /NCGR_PEP_ID=MMETSP1475-20131203/32135_1 /TAXON_ID= ORGANISM="Unidentified sp., Strain CCMP1999" /NCGR_SAMPLE_ID=MMETSP1475 /ASSEMBLY_ACC=CAM_ASM_001111 /LENGTH=742 /DNA_ID=CAMNT_0044494793 /DNA_START=137 /DNA_END=2362 /DNA_ORIENTATION=+
MLRVSTGYFPNNAEVKNASGAVWGSVVMPLAPLREEDRGSVRRRGSVGPAVLGSPLRTPISPVVLAGPLVSPVAAQKELDKGVTSADIARCAGCDAYICRASRVKTSLWRCSLCGKRNKLTERYTNYIESGVHLLEEMTADSFEVDAGTEETPGGSGYVFIIDLNRPEAELEDVKKSLLSAVGLLGNDDAAGLIVFGFGSLAILDTGSSASSRALFRRIKAKDGGCAVSVTAVLKAETWLRKLENGGKERLVSAINLLNKCMLYRNTVGGADGGNRILPSVRAVLTLAEALGENLAALRCICIVGSGLSSERPDDLIYEARRAINRGVMFDIALCSGDARADGADVTKCARDITQLARMSGGSLLVCSDAMVLRDEVCLALERPVAVGGVMRLRTTPDFLVSKCYGAGIVPDLEIPDLYRVNVQGISHTVAFFFQFSGIDGFRGCQLPPCAQVAYKFIELRAGWPTRRRLRVHTLQNFSEQSAASIRKHSDPTVVLSLLLHKILEAYAQVGADSARGFLRDWLSQLVRKGTDNLPAEKAHSAVVASPFLQKMIRLIFGVLNSRLFDDEDMQRLWERLPPEWLAIAAYPRLLAFVPVEDGKDAGRDGSQLREICLSLAAVNESKASLFIVDAFSKLALYLHTSAASTNVQFSFPPSEDATPMRVIRQLRRGRPLKPEFLILREGVPGDDCIFRSFLIEDDPLDVSESVSKLASLSVSVDMASQGDSPRQEHGAAYERFLREVL